MDGVKGNRVVEGRKGTRVWLIGGKHSSFKGILTRNLCSLTHRMVVKTGVKLSGYTGTLVVVVKIRGAFRVNGELKMVLVWIWEMLQSHFLCNVKISIVSYL